MSNLVTLEELQQERVTDWLLAILRFAITRDDTDRASLLAVANELDRPRPTADNGSFTFFTSTTTELCGAITAKHDAQRQKALRQHLNRIGNLRLRAALEAAVGLKHADSALAATPRSSRTYLWKGL